MSKYCIDPKTKEKKKITGMWFNEGLDIWMFSCNNNYDVFSINDLKPCKAPTTKNKE